VGVVIVMVLEELSERLFSEVIVYEGQACCVCVVTWCRSRGKDPPASV
jgi:hypothetical protein